MYCATFCQLTSMLWRRLSNTLCRYLITSFPTRLVSLLNCGNQCATRLHTSRFFSNFFCRLLFSRFDAFVYTKRRTMQHIDNNVKLKKTNKGMQIERPSHSVLERLHMGGKQYSPMCCCCYCHCCCCFRFAVPPPNLA